MRNIRNITFPRSGSLLLRDVLLRYFSGKPAFNFSASNWQEVDICGKFGYCREGHHCENIPCLNPKTTFQHTHDYATPFKDSDIYYLFQYRHPVYCIISLFSDKNYNLSGGRNHWTKEELIKEFNVTFTWWKDWIYKFIIMHEGNKICKLTYEHLMDNPEYELERVIKYIEPDKEVDVALLAKVINKIGIYSRHKVQDFERYEDLKIYFQRLEGEVMTELFKLDIPLIEWT